MRSTIFAVLGAMALVACGGSDDVKPHRSAAGDPSATGGAGNATGTDPGATASTPAQAACSAVATPKQIGAETNADDVQLVGTTVYYRSDAQVEKVNVDGTGRDMVFTSPALVRSYVDGTTLLAIEQPDPGDANATLEIVDLSAAGQADPTTGKPGIGGSRGQTATNLNAASTYVFGADAASFFLVSDDANGGTGDVIYSLDKATAALTAIGTVTGNVSDPQVKPGAIWYVMDQKRIFKIDLQYTDPGDPTQGSAPQPAQEMFGIGYAACNLAVGTAHTYCSTSAQIEQRDMTGGNPKTLLQASSSKIQSPFGDALSSGDDLVVKTDTGDGTLKHIIRGIAVSGDEHLVACGRESIAAFATSSTNVVWAEAGKGVFSAPR